MSNEATADAEEGHEKKEEGLESFATKHDSDLEHGGEDTSGKGSFDAIKIQQEPEFAKELYEKVIEEAESADIQLQQAQKAFENQGCCAKLCGSKAKNELEMAEKHAETKHDELKRAEEELQRLNDAAADADAGAVQASTSKTSTTDVASGTEDATSDE